MNLLTQPVGLSHYLVVGAVLIPGARAPRLVTRKDLVDMKNGSVIVDVAIDQGGCTETSRPTTHRDPTFVAENIIHYCVPNMTSVVARSATHALTNAVWPFVAAVANKGVEAAIAAVPALKRGVATHRGRVASSVLAAHLGVPEVTL